MMAQPELFLTMTEFNYRQNTDGTYYIYVKPHERPQIIVSDSEPDLESVAKTLDTVRRTWQAAFREMNFIVRSVGNY